MATEDNFPSFPNPNNLDLPLNPFIVLALIPQEVTTETEKFFSANRANPLSQTPFNISEFSTPSSTTSSVDAWNISSDLATFYSDELRRICFPFAPLPVPPRKSKGK